MKIGKDIYMLIDVESFVSYVLWSILGGSWQSVSKDRGSRFRSLMFLVLWYEAPSISPGGSL